MSKGIVLVHEGFEGEGQLYSDIFCNKVETLVQEKGIEKIDFMADKFYLRLLDFIGIDDVCEAVRCNGAISLIFYFSKTRKNRSGNVEKYYLRYCVNNGLLKKADSVITPINGYSTGSIIFCNSRRT